MVHDELRRSVVVSRRLQKHFQGVGFNRDTQKDNEEPEEEVLMNGRANENRMIVQRPSSLMDMHIHATVLLDIFLTSLLQDDLS